MRRKPFNRVAADEHVLTLWCAFDLEHQRAEPLAQSAKRRPAGLVARRRVGDLRGWVLSARHRLIIGILGRGLSVAAPVTYGSRSEVSGRARRAVS